VLAYPKFGFSANEQEELRDDYLPACEVVHVDMSKPTGPMCRDPEDQVFVELARIGHADCIVSGDKALLELNGNHGLVVLSLADFVQTRL
jgi:predicted nucleic acid-binding protein